MGMQAFAGVDATSVRNNIAALNSLKGVELDNQQLALLERTSTLMKGSEAMNQTGGGTTNFNTFTTDNSQNINQVSSAQFTIDDSPGTRESSGE